jgi:DNA-binding transcriptional MocR family regulator
MTRWAEESCHSSIQYGPTQGTASFRRALSKFLSAEYGPMASTHPDGLMQTSGATHGLALVLTTFYGRKRAGEKVAFIEDPSYFLAPNMFREQGFELVPVALKGTEGLDLDLLESAVLAAIGWPPVSEDNSALRARRIRSNSRGSCTGYSTTRPARQCPPRRADG